jgi:aspartyl-tRNA(Asn)/glutamyl-tRNA(Gln) amidotransferase subunit A
VNREDLAYATISELAPRIRDRELSPVEVTDAILERIARLNPALNAFITVTADASRRRAREAEAEIARGQYRGPLHGIPISLKDLYLTEGIRTTGGSKILADYIPTESSTVARRLDEAGSILLGKTNLHEFAYGTTTINPHHGTTRNPWDLERITAGSSGGTAAATAAGLGYASMGSETGFSIRRPAAFCGVVGLKPTYGRLSRFGMLPAAWSLDHAGPLTRSVRDAALVLNATAGYDPRDPASSRQVAPDFAAGIGYDVKGLRVGLPRHQYAGRCQPAVEAAFDAAVRDLEAIGAQVRDITLPRVNYATVASSVTMYGEVTASHAQWIRERPGDYGEDTRARIELGFAVTAVDYSRAQRIRRWIADEYAAAFGQVDLLACPTTPQVATPIAGGLPALNDPGFVVEESPYNLLRLFALIGAPAISVPCGFSPDGLPIGLTIAGRPFDEKRMIQLAAAYEAATDWHTRHPQLDVGDR